jgi:lysyl-tRNA synthetase class 2
MPSEQDERLSRLQKIENLKKQGIAVYPDRFDKQLSLQACKEQPDGSMVKTAGRLMLIRDMGKIIFAHIKDDTDKMQIAFKEDVLGKDHMKILLKDIDIGDFLGIEGERFETKTGEKTILVKQWTFLGKALRPLPDKWHGIQDKELKYRQRYLDLMMGDETKERFLFRSKFIKALRDFYEQEGFTEVETSILGNTASGALARPFKTHHNALDTDVYLRIALETPQKELIVGGFEKTFEIGKCFRNEGMDPSHLQEFTMVEHYAAYWNYENNMRFTEKMFSSLLTKLLGTPIIKIPDRNGEIREVDFTPPYKVVTMRDLLLKDSGIDIKNLVTTEELRTTIKGKKIIIEDMEKLEYGNLVDALYKKVSRPNMVGPLFLIEHPIELSPLARRNDKNPKIVDRFQLVVNGWELVNAYSELVDPVDQKQRFEDQATAQKKGDAEAHGKDDEYIKSMEYGMPPISGWGMGIDRIVSLLTGQINLRDIVLFPLMRPEGTDPAVTKSAEEKITIGCTWDDAQAFVKHHTSEQTYKHLLSVSAAMKRLCTVYQDEQNREAWEMAGLLHDIDWDKTKDAPEKHCGPETRAWLQKELHLTDKMSDIILSHNEATGIPRSRLIQKALFAVDELCGIITATALMRPSKSLADLQASSVIKKMKDKAFAAKVNRDWIKSCETELHTPLADFVTYAIEGMRTVAKELGL